MQGLHEKSPPPSTLGVNEHVRVVSEKDEVLESEGTQSSEVEDELSQSQQEQQSDEGQEQQGAKQEEGEREGPNIIDV